MTLQLASAAGLTIEECCMDKVEKIMGADHACCDENPAEDKCPIDDPHHCNCIYNITFISPQVVLDVEVSAFVDKPLSHSPEGKTKSFLDEIFQPPRV